MNAHDLAEVLQAELCTTFRVRASEGEEIAISSPFLFDDGDVLPVFLRRSEGGWILTDHGMAVSHLFFDEFQFTEARFARVAQLVGVHAARLSDTHEITMAVDGQPTAFDVATFLQLVAQVQGVALTSRTDRDQSRYVTTLRASVEERLQTADYEDNWSPPEVKDRTMANYRADLRIHSVSGADVVLFAASTSDKANVSALTMGQFKRFAGSRQFLPILAYHPDRVASEAVYRFQDEVETTESAVAVQPGDYRSLVGALRDRGVELVER